MSTELIINNVGGNESLSVGERLTSFFKEMSLGLDAFNARNFNKSIHTLKGIEEWKKIAADNVYFSAAIKHIPAPVLFDPRVWSFKDYVEFVLHAVPIVKLVDSQADNLYRGIKVAAAKGQVPFSIRNVNDLNLIAQARNTFKENMKDTGQFTRALNEMYPNFGNAYDIAYQFNNIVKTLGSRDIEIVSKRMDMVIEIVKLLKVKLDASDVILQPKEVESLNMAIEELVANASFAGVMLGRLADLNRVLQIQIDELPKLS